MLLALQGLLFGLPQDFEYLSLSLLTSQRKGHGIFVVVLPINGKLGLQLDAPPGIGQPPMIKKILPGLKKFGFCFGFFRDGLHEVWQNLLVVLTLED